MVNPVRSHIAPRTCEWPRVDFILPGDHKSRCRIEKGEVIGQEKQSSEDTRRWDRVAVQ